MSRPPLAFWTRNPAVAALNPDLATRGGPVPSAPGLAVAGADAREAVEVPRPRVVEFFVPGKPQAWQRVAGTGADAHVPAPTAAAEASIGWHARAAMAQAGLRAPLAGPVEVVWTARIERPRKTMPGLVWPVRQCDGDYDNILKCLLDACNGIVWVDDRQVVRESGCKVYGDEPGLDVRVEPLGEGEP